jgi:hypothetical protein
MIRVDWSDSAATLPPMLMVVGVVSSTEYK